jgi:peroxiredoxin
MHPTIKISWGVAIGILLMTGCTPPEPQAPATNVEPAKPQAAAVPEAANEEPQLAPPTNEPQEPIARTEESHPRGRTAFYRADTGPAEIPPVVLSKGHEALCKVKVGDTLPEIELPGIVGGDVPKPLADLYGETATVVVFWNSDRRMAREQLADLGPDVLQRFGDRGVAIVTIAVDESADSALNTVQQIGGAFPTLLDRDGEAFAKVGSEKLPRTFLLDPQGKILWFDIEYSHATRRELHQALRAVAGDAGRKQE